MLFATYNFKRIDSAEELNRFRNTDEFESFFEREPTKDPNAPVKKEHQCGNCYAVYGSWSAAKECCPVSINEVYRCYECDAIYTSAHNAKVCCITDDAGVFDVPQPA